MKPCLRLSLLATFVLSGTLAFGAPVRVACVGDSITYGYGLKDPAHDAWPVVLGRLLGSGYEVRNFGVSATTLLKRGNYPYWDRPAFKAATEFEPQIVVIVLGTNDTKPINWDTHSGEFAGDAAAMIEHFADLPSHPVVWIGLPPPIFANPFTINEANAVKIRAIWRTVAAAHHDRVIDFAPALAGKPQLFRDGVHPKVAGARLMAEIVAKALRAAPAAAAAAR